MTIATVLHEGQSPTIDCPDSRHAASHQGPHEKGVVVNGSEDSAVCSNTFASDHTHRKLKPRHIQLIGIGGTIGTALYVQIGKGLMHGGPGSLFLAFLIWSLVILCITVCKRPYCSTLLASLLAVRNHFSSSTSLPTTASRFLRYFGMENL
ncbi:hypothetical protein BP00DRAFT_203489 [Aspergillus indologenus CBS 114.80]|uniref:Amino acid permease/ SLC12A domain-containing protein n=1 Tax=Aspergillus indologenus CBS 114.80 TaxID=1450541 RepID=A0A2V5I8D3_9EURO|nr:hypothetical protein BP00DRAFT_203489 [Aspergillus indologenus CBS 114.80]